MTFGQSYLDHMRCLEDVGMLSTTPIQYNGQEIVPIQFLKASASGSCKSWTTYKRKNKHRLYFYRL